MGDDLQNLVRAARNDGPSAAEAARLEALVMARLMAPPAAPAPGPAHAPSAGVKVIVSVKGLLGAAFGLALVAFGGGYWLGQRPAAALSTASLAPSSPPPSAPSTVAPPPVEVTAMLPSPPPSEAVPTPSDASRQATPPSFPPGAPRVVLPPASDADLAMAQAALDEPPSAPSPEQSVGKSSLGAELALLRQAQEALRDGDSAETLHLLGELDATFPAGVLSAERDALRVVALCAAERTAEAKVFGERFRKQHPGSPYAARVDASCAGER